MKLPFTFSFASLIRLFLPGLILGLALYPWVSSFLIEAQISFSEEYLLSVLIFVAGWLTTLLDMHIYMLFEGRRFWPQTLRLRGLRLEKARLKRLECKERRARDAFENSDDIDYQREYQEASIEIRRFPINPETGDPVALWPTRLGNLLASFESYPNLIYGIDAVFLWPRVRIQLDKDLRSEIDNSQAVADSSLYVSFAFIIGSFFLFAFPIMSAIVDQPVIRVSPVVFPLLGATAAALSYLTYRVSMHAHAQFGETFKAVFDIYHDKAVIDVEKQLTAWTGSNILERKSSRERSEIVWNFLHNYAIYDEEEDK